MLFKAVILSLIPTPSQVFRQACQYAIVILTVQQLTISQK